MVKVYLLIPLSMSPTENQSTASQNNSKNGLYVLQIQLQEVSCNSLFQFFLLTHKTMAGFRASHKDPSPLKPCGRWVLPSMSCDLLGPMKWENSIRFSLGGSHKGRVSVGFWKPLSGHNDQCLPSQSTANT